VFHAELCSVLSACTASWPYQREVERGLEQVWAMSVSEIEKSPGYSSLSMRVHCDLELA